MNSKTKTILASLACTALGYAVGASGSSGTPVAAPSAAVTVPGPTVTVTATPAAQPAAPVTTQAAAQPKPKPTGFGSGMQIVGTDIRPGTYKASHPAGYDCYWERDRNFTGGVGSIIANGFGDQGVVTIRPTDKGFSSSGCGTWTKIG